MSPLYEYNCHECEECFERICLFKERDTQKCHKCGADLELQVSVPGYFRPGLFGKGGHGPTDKG
jgi:putative FmdB family regulatory protein